MRSSEGLQQVSPLSEKEIAFERDYARKPWEENDTFDIWALRQAASATAHGFDVERKFLDRAACEEMNAVLRPEEQTALQGLAREVLAHNE